MNYSLLTACMLRCGADRCVVVVVVGVVVVVALLLLLLLLFSVVLLCSLLLRLCCLLRSACACLRVWRVFTSHECVCLLLSSLPPSLSLSPLSPLPATSVAVCVCVCNVCVTSYWLAY